MRAWRRFERSEAMRDTLAEIRRTGRSVVTPVSSPGPAADARESDQSNQSQIARREIEDAPQSNHNSINSQTATETIQ